MNDRRRSDTPTTTIGYLQHLPALVLLDRLPTPVIGIDPDGALSYVNPAFAHMLGYTDTDALKGRSIETLLVGRATTSAKECVTVVSEAGDSVVEWRHAEAFPVRTLVSESMLLRSADPLVLVSVNDVTEWSWMVDGNIG